MTPPDANILPTCPSSMPTAAAVAAAAVTAKITAMDVATTQLPKPEEPAAPTGVRVCTENVYGYAGFRLQRVPLQGAPGYNEQIFFVQYEQRHRISFVCIQRVV